jgi:hypothetical protein
LQSVIRRRTVKWQKDKQRSSRIYNDKFPLYPFNIVVTVLKWNNIRLVCQTTLARCLCLAEHVGVQIQFWKKVSLLYLNVREYQRPIQKWKSKETDNLGYIRRNKTKQKHNTIYVGHHYAETNTINVNKTCALQQTPDKTGTKHNLCEIYVNITNGVIFFTYHEQYYIEIHVQI